MKTKIITAIIIATAICALCLQYKGERMNKFEGTDPEFAEFFENFSQNEVAHYGKLKPKTRLQIILASAIATQSLNLYKIMLEKALDNEVTPVEAKEIVYQAVPYAGYARVYDFINATNEILEKRGVKLPLPTQATTSRTTRFEKGLALQKSIFGEQIDKMREETPQNQKHIQDYLSANCFGDYYTRNGLDVKTRELLTYAMLISLGGADAQVRGHIQGNLNSGNDKEVLLEATTQLLPFIGYPRTLNALSALNEIIPEKQGE